MRYMEFRATREESIRDFSKPNSDLQASRMMLYFGGSITLSVQIS